MNNLRGAVLMTTGMGLFALADMFIKLVSVALPIGQILLIMGTGGASIFAALVARSRQSLLPAGLLHPTILLRNLAEVTGTYGFVTALALTPLTSASAILQAMPLVVTMMAAVFLGERVGWRRWSAILVGFAGVLLILRPASGDFEPASLFAVLGVLGLATRDLTTRIAPPAMSSLQLAQWGFAMLVPLGAGLLLASGGAAVPAPRALAQLGAIIVIAVAGYYVVVVAIRISDLSAVAPFRYSRLAFAMLLGIGVLGERPDSFTLAGTALIVASGLYAFARERALFSEARQG